MTMKALILVILFTVAAGISAVSQQEALDWAPGMYWTYDATIDGWGVSNDGEVTFLVLSEDSNEGLHRWNLAVITDWHDGTELLAVTSHSTSGILYPWRRWPQIVDYLPHTHLPNLETQFRQVVGSLGLPWIGEEYSATYELSSIPLRRESITLLEMGPLPISEPITDATCTQDNIVSISYEWTSHYANIAEKLEEGAALWSSCVQWWVQARGDVFNHTFPVVSYEITLTSSGTLTSSDLLQRLTDALNSTIDIIPEYAAGLIGVFEGIGIQLP